MSQPEAPIASIRDAKQCNTCGHTKPLSEFKVKVSGRAGRQAHCLPCARAHQRVRNMTKAYGVDGPYLYDRLLAQQGGRCAVCKVREIDSRGTRGTRFHIDHDHATGKVRGLLCHPCNLALGHAQDDSTRLRAMADYLETSP